MGAASLGEVSYVMLIFNPLSSAQKKKGNSEFILLYTRGTWGFVELITFALKWSFNKKDSQNS